MVEEAVISTTRPAPKNPLKNSKLKSAAIFLFGLGLGYLIVIAMPCDCSSESQKTKEEVKDTASALQEAEIIRISKKDLGDDFGESSNQKFADSFDQLEWDTYSNEDVGISFEYPINQGHREGVSAYTISDEFQEYGQFNWQFRLNSGMAYNFEIKRIVTDMTMDEWVVSENNPLWQEKAAFNTSFQGKPAIYIPTSGTPEGAFGIIYVEHKGNILEIAYATPFSLDGERSEMIVAEDEYEYFLDTGTKLDTYVKMSTYNSRHLLSDSVVMQRILNSFRFL